MPALTSDLRARLVQLFAGLVLFGVCPALVVEADLGLDPWNVFHQGISERTGIGLGWVVIIVSGVVLAAVDPAPPAARDRHRRERHRRRPGHRGGRRP